MSDHKDSNDFGQSGHDPAGVKVFFFSMAVTLVFFIALVFFSKGIDLKEVRESAEKVGDSNAAAVAAAPKFDASTVKEPWIESAELVAHGKEVYQTSCAMCHGAEAKGDGPAGMSLNPKPRNLVEGTWKKQGDSLGLFDTISNGFAAGSSMSAWKASINKVDRWALVHFIRSVTKNKVKDDEAKLKEKAPSLD